MIALEDKLKVILAVTVVGAALMALGIALGVGLAHLAHASVYEGTVFGAIAGAIVIGLLVLVVHSLDEL